MSTEAADRPALMVPAAAQHLNECRGGYPADPSAASSCEVGRFTKKLAFDRDVSTRDTSSSAPTPSTTPSSSAPKVDNAEQKAGGLVMAAGHEASIKSEADGRYILKPLDPVEKEAYEALWSDPKEPLCAFASKYLGVVQVALSASKEPQSFLRLENLLQHFNKENACVMDIKLGVRTFQEDLVQDTTLRKDLYQKLVKLFPDEVSEEERISESCTKLKWMSTRDKYSTTSTLGFRVDGIVSMDGMRTKQSELNKLTSRNQLLTVMQRLLPTGNNGHTEAVHKRNVDLTWRSVAQLRRLREALVASPFFAAREVIGCSLLFIVDPSNVGVFLIDLAKTKPLPPGFTTDHRRAWEPGNHEDGVLFGVESLIDTWEEVLKVISSKDDHAPVVNIMEQQLQDPLVAAMKEKLDAHGVDYSNFGHRTVQELTWEVFVQRGSSLEVDNEAGSLVRVVEVIKAWLVTDLGDGPITLMEDNYHEGRGNEMKPLQKKVVPGEDWHQAVLHGIADRFHISDPSSEHFDIRKDTHEQRDENLLGSRGGRGFAGLMTRYRVHEVDVYIVDPLAKEMSLIGLPDANDFATMEEMSISTLFGKSIRYWRWEPFAESKYADRGLRGIKAVSEVSIGHRLPSGSLPASPAKGSKDSAQAADHEAALEAQRNPPASNMLGRFFASTLGVKCECFGQKKQG